MTSDANNLFEINNGWLVFAEQQKSPHFTPREDVADISLLVVHNISLPPGQFGGPYITDLFLGRLDADADPYFQDIYQLRVSAHCLIRRDGSIVQYVSFNDKAWHAGVSSFGEREKCNDFSIGIELEGTDEVPYTREQYQQLVCLVAKLQETYPLISHNNLVGHSDIAPGRKTDPGPAFDWEYFRNCLQSIKESSQ
ncbi:1,6-anhydro-N-acetylmuramyl-L-alanine amidase AmpD [Thalassomonas actiniarum]|uniref:1,6-anhydro-N-acetylmuramyl-L-alanine amidase AmpD n=1 Tax=Thalassomonas actiniarum TaxID=485447 RepID=A0AAE9YQJ6_9GAMM|nr:1,6-anhydro-N-acetylmuramyl-L-alanine amidase AmpD [Thalassomonas actiniarum]WDD98433.1 1,6-anhydro-N-acetylmuramyl-L-alanine amidase AmpD [Thalassomonas actiniarum]